MFFALVYAIALAPFLPFGSTAARNLLKGLVFGTVLAVVALLIMTPLVYNPDDSVVPRAVDRLENPGTQLRQPVG